MKTENVFEIHILKIVILSQSASDGGKHTISKRIAAVILILLSASIYLVSAYICSQENNFVTQTIMSRPYYFVDNNTSNVDFNLDKGNQANFTAQQYGPDSVYDMLTEEGATEVIEDYVDGISDVDSSPDVGTLSFFYKIIDYDSTYDTLNETTSGGGIQVTQTVVEDFNAPAGTTHDITLSTADVGDLWVVVIAANPDGFGTVPNINLPSGWNWIGTQTNHGATSDGMLGIIYRVKQSGDSSTLTTTYTQNCMVAAIVVTYEGVDTINPLDVAVPTYDVTENPPTSPDIITVTDGAWVCRATLVDGTPGFGDSDIPSGTTLRGTMVNNPPSNGQNLGFADEIQETAGSAGSADWGSGAGTEEAVSATFALRPASGSEDYDLDLEVQFTNIIDFLPTEKLCIYMGTMGAEALNVSYWTGSDWNLLDSDLTASSWNNYTVSLISANFTIRFETETLTGDSSADEYQVDAVLLQVSGVGSKEDPVDQQSDVDSSPDVGTHSNFTAQQYGPDSIYDTLTEEDTGGGSTTFGKTDVGASSRGFTGYLEASRYQCGQDFTVTKILLYLSGGASGYYARTAIYSDSSGAPGSLLGESAEQEVASDGWHEFTGFNVPVSESTYYWLAFQISTSNLAYHYDTGAANQHAYRAYTYGPFPSTFGSPSYTAEAQSIYAASSVVNYEIDFEIQWKGLPSSLPNEELCISTGTFSGSETIQVKVWNSTGSSWNWIMNLTANQWNNVSITDYLTSNQFTIQFLGGNETGDLTQDTWEIDVAIIHIWIAENYEIDLEVQWTNVDYSETNEELCIHGGTMGSENLQVDVWTGASWQNVIPSLNNGWNNYTVSSYLTSSTFTIRFKGSNETADSIQDSWDIDATLLHVWT